jgi:hypothetical protein
MAGDQARGATPAGPAWSEKKNAAKCPGAKEGGREEEEKRPGISTGRPGSLHSVKT